MLTHLQWVRLSPTGSYDDDDILTEAPRGHSQHQHFAGCGAGDFSFGASSGENLDGADDACGPLG